MALHITSPEFSEGEVIPKKLRVTRRTSPAIGMNEPPANTKSFALIMDDPTPPRHLGVIGFCTTFPRTPRNLQSGCRARTACQRRAAGRNDFGKNRPTAAVPAARKAAPLFLKLYAVDTKLNLKSGVTRLTWNAP